MWDEELFFPTFSLARQRLCAAGVEGRGGGRGGLVAQAAQVVDALAPLH